MGKVLRLHPAPSGEPLAAEDVYADLRRPDRAAPASAPRVAINMVATVDGKVAVGGESGPISSGLDRLIMKNIRRHFDAVLVGAGTVRAEETNLGVPERLSRQREADGLPGQPLAVILAGFETLPLQRKAFRPRDQRVIVIAGDATPEPTLEEASALGVGVLRAEGSDLPAPREVLRMLKERLGVGAVLLEGGPKINGAFLSAGEVDEIFLTLSPKTTRSQPDAPTLSSPPPSSIAAAPATTDLDLVSVHASIPRGELYLRYLRNHPPAIATPNTSFR